MRKEIKQLACAALAVSVMVTGSQTVLANEGDSNYSKEMIEASMINRAASAKVKGGKSWGTIIGDNNKLGETVRVYNCSGKSIKIKAYTENGTLRKKATIAPGEYARAGFWIADGTYYFKVQFVDKSEGTITIRMETEWL